MSVKNVPRHVGIIMDGNRRWAKERNLPNIEGHVKGYDVAKKLPDWFFARGVEIVSLYAFSTENWKRSAIETNFLMTLLGRAIKEEAENAIRNGYKLVISGRLDDLPGNLPNECRDILQKTAHGTKGIVNICLSYGGRSEILDSVKTIIQKGIKAEDITEEVIGKNLYHGELGDPDIIVRTSGEQRLSGFLLWQSAYSELLFLKKYWPEFEENDVAFILEEYSKRQRRFGAN